MNQQTKQKSIKNKTEINQNTKQTQSKSKATTMKKRSKQKMQNHEVSEE